MSDLTDELLKIIATGTGRAYNHESKAMAHELIRRRAADAELIKKLTATQPIQPNLWNTGVPYP